MDRVLQDFQMVGGITRINVSQITLALKLLAKLHSCLAAVLPTFDKGFLAKSGDFATPIETFFFFFCQKQLVTNLATFPPFV